MLLLSTDHFISITIYAAMEKYSYYIFTFAVLLLTFQVPNCLAKKSRNIITDEYALLSLKTSFMLDSNHILTKNWTHSSSVCSWIGVTCSSLHHRVSALDIYNMSVAGVISPYIGNLSFLVSLDLGYNFLSGILPQELSLLRRLKFISLRNNNFKGEIPSWFGHLPKLEFLSLRNNTFTGPMSSTIFNISTFKTLHLEFNQLSGSLPTDMCGKLPILEDLVLSANQLSGQIPPNISQCSQLKILALSYNSFGGQIPPAIGKLKYLQILYLGGNNLNGVIPEEIGNLHNLVEFSIEKNLISGPLPLNVFFNMTSLQSLLVWRNKLCGKLPKDIGNLTMLYDLQLHENNFRGVIPIEIGRLYRMENLLLYQNSFTGSIPPELFNISTLRFVDLGQNGLSGELSSLLCIGSPNLEELLLGINDISGAIPDSISRCAHLTIFELTYNKFTGFVPHFLGNLSRLEILGLSNNKLRFESYSFKLRFFTSLANCASLTELSIGNNPLGGGILPPSIGNLSSSLQTFYAPNCRFNGRIPNDIGNLSNLMELYLDYNELSGIIPPTFKHLHKLQGLYLPNNNLEGLIPDGLCDLPNLVQLNLGGNQLSGAIPICLGNISSLRGLYLYSNILTSAIPSSMWRLKDLLSLDLSSNSLTGFLPSEIGNLVAAAYINISMNHLSETIPDTIGNLENLMNLSLAHNRLEGSIPVSVGSMVGLVSLDLSYNNLSGSIPKSLEALQYLRFFNISFNSLKGEIPSGGPFRNFTLESFIGNSALCGNQTVFPGIPLCPAVSRHKPMKKKVQAALFVLAGVVAFITVATLVFILIRCKRKDKMANRVDELVSIVPQRISYYEILQSTDHFNESNLLGVGSYGSVYRGVLRDGMMIAVKVFNQQSEDAFKSFDVECEVLRNIRHRNLTKVLSSCCNPDFKALVLEYMPNASLEKWLYSHNFFLDARQRLDVVMDVASALEYLHHGYSTVVVHCDMKPSNVLLDENMIAHVCDFGISKLLGDEETSVLTNTLATLGYIAPEYGLEGIVSTRCDVYSYGVMLMETFTRKRPSDMFGGDLSLRSWVNSLLPQSPDQVIDVNLFIELGDEHGEKIIECVSSILVVALKCTAESPQDRINIKEVLVELRKIKAVFPVRPT